ncbi:MAG: lysylphosphatidylglycerol synthase transmembrane domain-containing protein, partial [Mariprofundaceae bacterium]
LACMCLLIGQVFSAVRWAWLAEGLGLGVNILRKIQLYFLGMFLSLFLPSIIGGDVARGWMLARGRKAAGWPAAASVIMERISGVFGITLLVTSCLFFLTIPELFSTLWYTAVAGLWLAMLLTPWWWPRLQALQVKRLAGWQQLPLLSPGFRSAWWRSMPVSVLFQALVIQAHVFLGMAVGLDLSWAVYGFIVCLVALASALPLSFNGFGIREGGYVGLAVWFGGNSDAAAAMAMLWVLVMVIVAAPGGMVLWRLGGTGALRKPSED